MNKIKNLLNKSDEKINSVVNYIKEKNNMLDEYLSNLLGKILVLIGTVAMWSLIGLGVLLLIIIAVVIIAFICNAISSGIQSIDVKSLLIILIGVIIYYSYYLEGVIRYAKSDDELEDDYDDDWDYN